MVGKSFHQKIVPLKTQMFIFYPKYKNFQTAFVKLMLTILFTTEHFECQLNDSLCPDVRASCVDVDNSYECQCNTGYGYQGGDVCTGKFDENTKKVVYKTLKKIN